MKYLQTKRCKAWPEPVSRSIRANISENIRTEIRRGYAPREAAAIAYGIARQECQVTPMSSIFGVAALPRVSFSIRFQSTTLRPRVSLSNRPTRMAGSAGLKTWQAQDVYVIALAIAGSHSRVHAPLRPGSSSLKRKSGGFWCVRKPAIPTTAAHRGCFALSIDDRVHD